MYEPEDSGSQFKELEPILVAGAHELPLPQAEVWRLLNEPVVLKQSIKGTEEVVRLSPNGFRARIGVWVGPVKFRLTADLRIREHYAPESFCLESEISMGLLGGTRAQVEVYLLSTAGGAASWINYLAVLRPVGALRLLLRLHDAALPGYIDQFLVRFLQAANIVDPVGTES